MKLRTMPSVTTRWGITSDAFLKTDGLSLRFSHWYLAGADSTEQADRETHWIETCLSQKAAASVIAVPARLQAEPTAPKRIQSLTRIAKRYDVNLFFEFGRLGPPAWVDPEICVSDPLWFRGEVWSRYWKIHGWHAERWVRFYSPADLDYLRKLAEHFRPAFVVLGHSQREKQREQLLKRLGERVRNLECVEMSFLRF